MLSNRFSALRLLGTFLIVLGVSVPVSGSPTSPMPRNYTLAQPQLPFIENAGQITNSNVKFYTQAKGATLYVTQQGEIYYSLRKSDKEKQAQGWVIKESFPGKHRARVTGKNQTMTKVNHFNGSKTSAWKKAIPAYERVRLGERYPGVELELKAHSHSVEKIFHVRPHADPGQIRIKLAGAKNIVVDDAGELVVQTDLGEIKFARPIAYQNHQGEKQQVPVAYTVAGTHYGFVLGDYDKTQPLVIDPLLASTFVGGGSGEEAKAMALDSSGNVYIGGETVSADFPTTPGAYRQLPPGSSDAFVLKLDPELKTLLAATFLGGSGSDRIHALTLDGTGNVYVAGWTSSSDFPTTPEAYAKTGSNGGFIAKLDSQLNNLLASTYFGGGWSTSLSLDGNGSIYVAGHVNDANLPVTAGAYDTTPNGNWDVYVAKLDTNLKQLLASTLLGGSDYDADPAVLTNGQGQVIVSGTTRSPEFPTKKGAYDTTHNGSRDVFVSIFDADLRSLLASSFLGGSGSDEQPFLTADINGNIYVTGSTQSADFPTTMGAYQRSYRGGSADAFVARLSSDLSTLAASTLLGGGNYDIPLGIALGLDGSVYVTGRTASFDFPTTPSAYDPTHNGQDDAFVSKLNNALDSLLASTYLGGAALYGDDFATTIATANTGDVLVAGATWSSDFPVTAQAYDTTPQGPSDVFVAKLDAALSKPVSQPDISVSPTSLAFTLQNLGSTSAPKLVTVYNRGDLELILGTIAIEGANPTEFKIQNNNCSEVKLPPATSCTLEVVFAPLTSGLKSARIPVPSNDPDTGLVSITLSGQTPQACTSNLECGFTSYCAKPVGQCTGAGLCSLRPQACIALYAPVCGCDGRTYGNSCEAANAGVSVAYDGSCLSPPVVSGFWPGSGGPGTLVFVFGNNFVPYKTSTFKTTVKVNGVAAPAVQVLDKTLLFFVVPDGVTSGPITVTTPGGTGTSQTNFGAGTASLQVNGIWPSQARVGDLVFVFGSGFDVKPGGTQVSVNGVTASVFQALDPTLLFFVVPQDATSGPVKVSTSAGSAISASSLTIVP